MFHNTTQYWRHLQALPSEHQDRPSARVCRLLDRIFKRWNDPPRWPEEGQVGHLFDYKPEAKNKSVSIRRGMAIREMLNLVTRDPSSSQLGTLEIHPDELIVGAMPPFSVGQGKELVGHLKRGEGFEGEEDDETLSGWLNFLNDRSAFGHIVPCHARVLELGIVGVIELCEDRRREAAQECRDFYSSVLESLHGVIEFADAFSNRAREIAERLPQGSDRRANMLAVADRVAHTPRNPPRTFVEAVQCFFLTHCALHTTGEVVSIGRLDQLLNPYFERDFAEARLNQAQAQEIIDCLWVKLGERVIINREHAQDRFTFADGALLGAKGPSNFDQGGLLNQWMQQVTIGGYLANDSVSGQDGTNEVTFLCLEASRRLPLNSPTLDLRVHKSISERYRDKLFRSAAQTIMSGGAHPILMNDDLIVPALWQHTGGKVALSSARNYACDGCYETLFAGETEFSFGFVAALPILEHTLNRGADLGATGPVHLRGMKASYRTKHVAEIESWDEFWSIYSKHLELSCHRFLHGILTFYGEKEAVCPSPLLSALVEGCLEKGRDLTGGGARYHLFSPLMTGISTCADSLYVIRNLVFPQDGKRRAFTLQELVTCLRANWAKDWCMVKMNPEIYLTEARIKEIHGLCCAQAKFGQGDREVDQLAWQLINQFCGTVDKVRDNPIHAANWGRLRKRFGDDFEILLAPGVGTFEQYVFGGGFASATPDGRYSNDPIASDLSPSPVHRQVEPYVCDNSNRRHAREIGIKMVLESYRDPSVSRLSDGAPADLNLPEDFPEDELVDAIRAFAYGYSGNMMTFTVADPETFRNAQKNPEQYNLVRVRMGGWTEFFVSLFPQHQEQHRRRPLVVPK